MNTQSAAILAYILLFLGAGFAAGFAACAIIAKAVITGKNTKGGR